MRFLTKLEEWINKYLLLVGQMPFRLYEKFVPERIKTKISAFFLNIRTRPKDFFINSFTAIKNLPSKIKENQGELIHIFHICIQSIKQALEAIKHFDITKLKNGKWQIVLREKCNSLSSKIFQIYENTSPQTLLLLAFVLTIGSLAIFQIYNSSSLLFKKEFPDSFVEKSTFSGVRRPAYHDRTKKSFYVTNISIPFSFEGAVVDKEAEGIKSLIVDIEVETSNRYLTVYLSTQEHVIKDYLNKKLEPVMATFPLTQEGKRVIRAKIIKELNHMIEETGAKGTVENVFIINITVS